MQLIDTHVGQPNEGMVTVEFRGEGGELVSVKTASANLEGAAAVKHAKAILVQLTSFAEDRDPSNDHWDHTQDDVEHSEERGSEVSEAKSELPVVSSFGDALSSAV